MARWLGIFLAAAAVFVPANVGQAGITVGEGVSDWNVTLSNGHFQYTGWTGYFAWIDPKTGTKYKTQTGLEEGYWSGKTAQYHDVAPSSSTARQPTYWGTAGLSVGTVQYLVEDTKDGSNSYYVGPVAGGQNFDAEFLAALVDQGKLYIAVGSGQRSDNRFQYFQPGDIQLVTQNQTSGRWSIYGIEVGGGGQERSHGMTFTLNSSGYTTGVTTITTGQVAGTLWQTATGLADETAVKNSTAGWRAGYASEMGDTPYKRVQLDLSNPKTPLATVDFDYAAAPDDGYEHSWIEAAVDLSDLGLGEQVKYVGWAPSCANDRMYMMLEIEASAPIPEPVGLAIWCGLGLVGAGLARWGRRRG